MGKSESGPPPEAFMSWEQVEQTRLAAKGVFAAEVGKVVKEHQPHVIYPRDVVEDTKFWMSIESGVVERTGVDIAVLLLEGTDPSIMPHNQAGGWKKATNTGFRVEEFKEEPKKAEVPTPDSTKPATPTFVETPEEAADPRREKLETLPDEELQKLAVPLNLETTDRKELLNALLDAGIEP